MAPLCPKIKMKKKGRRKVKEKKKQENLYRMHPCMPQSLRMLWTEATFAGEQQHVKTIPGEVLSFSLKVSCLGCLEYVCFRAGEEGSFLPCGDIAKLLPLAYIVL